MTSLTALTHHRGGARHERASLVIRLFPLVTAVLNRIQRARACSARRRELRALVDGDDQHLLSDIGLTREQALREAAKWPWQN